MITQYFVKQDDQGLFKIMRNGDQHVNPPDGYLEVSGSDFMSYEQTPLPQPRLISKFSFLRLLSPTEYAAMFTQTDPVLAHGAALFQAASDPFDIDDPLVESMLAYCVGTGVLTQARRDELWAAMEAAA